MNNTITVEIRDVYGQSKIYPVCDKAKIFADIAGTKTILPADIQRIQVLGYNVQVKQREGKKRIPISDVVNAGDVVDLYNYDGDQA